jgi:hypothetical protein
MTPAARAEIRASNTDSALDIAQLASEIEAAQRGGDSNLSPGELRLRADDSGNDIAQNQATSRADEEVVDAAEEVIE